MLQPEQHRGRKVKCRNCGRIMRAGRRPNVVSRVASRVFGWAGRLTGRFGEPASATMPAARRKWLRVVARLTWAYLAAVIVVASLLWGFADAWWPATVLLFMGRWVFLLPLALLVPAAIFLRPLLLVPVAIAAVIVTGPRRQ